MPLSANEVLLSIQSRSDFIFHGWNLLLLAGLGVLVVAGLCPRRVGRAVLGVFVFFALTHLLGMLHVVKQWASLTESLKHELSAQPVLLEKLDFAILAPTLAWIVPFHLVFDALVVALGWRLSTRQT
jgi:hypothetical protein